MISGRKNTVYIHIIAFIIMSLLLVYEIVVLRGSGYYLISFAIILTALLAGLLSFEGRRVSAPYTAILAVFCALSVSSRIVLSPFPQIKPIAAIVILSGAALGKTGGFMCGVVSMFISNFYFMQGSWTPFQMLGMGLVGYLAGVFFSKKGGDVKTSVIVAVYGFVSVIIIYGLLVDISTVYYTLGSTPDMRGIVTVYAMGLPFDLVFAISTFAYLILLYRPFMKKWSRLRERYNI